MGFVRTAVGSLLGITSYWSVIKELNLACSVVSNFLNVGLNIYGRGFYFFLKFSEKAYNGRGTKKCNLVVSPGLNNGFQ